MPRRHPNSRLVAVIKKYRLLFAAATVLFNAAALAAVVFVFPNVSNLWVSIFVLVSGFTSSMLALGDLLVSSEDSLRDDGKDPSSSPLA